jgi:hypothetical protein
MGCRGRVQQRSSITSPDQEQGCKKAEDKNAYHHRHSEVVFCRYMTGRAVGSTTGVVAPLHSILTAGTVTRGTVTSGARVHYLCLSPKEDSTTAVIETAQFTTGERFPADPRTV